MVTIQERRNQCSRLLKDGMRINLWDPRFNVHNEWKHEAAKCKLLYELKKEGKHAIGEAIFKNGARADILVLDDFRVIEVLNSETKEEALRKEDYYPTELDIQYKDCEDVLYEDY